MNDLETLQTSFVAFIDGLWWGLRDNTGPLSMYEGYSRGFRQMGFEVAEKIGGKGAVDAAEIAGKIFTAIGLDIAVDDKSIIVNKCPIWTRILERGLEFAFHIEEICWMPMLEGIGEKTGAKPEMETSLRIAHLETTKVQHKKMKLQTALDKGSISKEHYDKEILLLDEAFGNAPTHGLYRFK